jgi:hypothetical protein
MAGYDFIETIDHANKRLGKVFATKADSPK